MFNQSEKQLLATLKSEPEKAGLVSSSALGLEERALGVCVGVLSNFAFYFAYRLILSVSLILRPKKKFFVSSSVDLLKQIEVSEKVWLEHKCWRAHRAFISRFIN